MAGTTERFTSHGVLESVDYVKMTFPRFIKISKRDRITNIRNRKGQVVWAEEEHDGSPTVFNVMGVTPVLDPFGNWIENFALLARSEDQRG